MTKAWTAESDIPNLTGKIVVVTGGNAGLGYYTVAGLAAHGAKVYMGARSESRARDAIKKLHTENPALKNGQILWLPLDLANPQSVVKAAETVARAETRLDILVNNAGTLYEHFETNEQGFEMTMVVNHLGHFLFTQRLLPLLKDTASKSGNDVRVVTVASVVHSTFAPSGISFLDLSSLKQPQAASPAKADSWLPMMRRYGLSKLANILFASELQRRLQADSINSIISISLDPGAVSSDSGLSIWPGFMKPFLVAFFFTIPSKAVKPTLFAAAAEEVRKDGSKYKGQYLSKELKVIEPSSQGKDEKLAENLWDLSETAVQQMLRESA